MIKKYFPYTKPREGQIESIINILKAIEENNYKFICLDAQTGFGKTAIAQTINNYYTQEYNYDSYILTSTKILQEQYLKDTTTNNKFKINYQIAKGKGNYSCSQSYQKCDKCNTDDTITKCEYKINSKKLDYYNGCEYWNAKIKTINSDTALLNYSLKIADEYYGVNHYQQRNLGILDEAHNIESTITNAISLELTQKEIRKNDIINQDNLIPALENILENTKNRTKQTQIINTLKLIKKDPYNWTITQFNNNITTRIPIYITNYTKDLLLKNTSEITIFMSGSFIETDQFIKDLGITEEVYIEKPKNKFNFPKNNPIIIYTAGSMGWEKRNTTIPKTYEKLEKIFNKHKKEKGIIHTHKKEYTKNIIKHFKNTKHNNRLTTNLNQHKKSKKPLILVSHNLQEGVDFKYDECRFQVLYKAPFLPLNDNQIRKRMEFDPEWYSIKAMQKFQ